MNPLILMSLFTAMSAFLGGFVQRVSGFGFGIITMIFLPYVLGEYGEANLLASLLSVSLNLMIIGKVGKHTDWKSIIIPAVAYAAVNIPAVYLLKSRPNGMLFVALGAALVLMSVWFVFISSKVKIKAGPVSGAVCGGLSGFLGGFFSMSGPPAVVYFLQSSEGDNLRYLGTIQAFFLITNAFTCGVKIASGLMTANVAWLFAAGLVGVLAGEALGGRVFNRLDTNRLRTAVYVFMAAAGVLNIVSGLSGLLS